jgi:hypothetical protein
MEAVGESAPSQATRLGRLSNARTVTAWPAARTLHSIPADRHLGVPPEPPTAGAIPSDGDGSGGLGRSLELLKNLSTTASADAALFDFREASDFAGQVEELSRTMEYLQLVAAGAVDRTRNVPASWPAGGRAASGWTTGWNAPTTSTGWVVACPDGSAAEQPGTEGSPSTGWAVGPDRGAGMGWNAQATSGAGSWAAVPAAAPVPVASGPVDDGFRTTTEFLRDRLRISAVEARRRLSLAGTVLPRTGIAGQQRPPEREELAHAVVAGDIASRAATIITLALDRVRHIATEDTAARMEHALTRTAAENDPDFLARMARRWTDAIDQDGAEPSEAELNHRQGAFLRPARRGLHHLEIFATAEQYEHLLTVMNTATNPRTSHETEASTSDSDAGGVTEAGTESSTGDVPTLAVDSLVVSASGGESPAGDCAGGLDRRTRPQLLLDGLIGACKAALSTGALPTAGGLRPQVMVTIAYQDLLARLEHTTEQGPRRHPATRTGTATGAGAGAGPGAGARTGTRSGNGTGPGTESPGGAATATGTFTFTGPVTAATVRKIACDADIIPVLLGSEGRVLDIGRTTRIFPPHIRKAITARDQGCAFPNCTIPAPWCEAHHITYWSHGGTTGTDNGTLLCSHHHHLIHKEQWTIHLRTGIPWFIPPPHLDPRQVPRRNHHFRG